MNISTKHVEQIISAESKALATSCSMGINVVPVSTIKYLDEKIILVNYFMGKTLNNIKENPEVALVCWKGLEGIQIKGVTEYVEKGDLYTSIKEWVKQILPDRVVKGILVLTPHELYDISVTSSQPGQKL